ncbi:MAG: TrbG/VirB9 family P-type conjugative transfer protein [Betaproteobacteria bacterium]|nr:TrbG/VirB9 family P-type conjugative transfer protein [Betaproteobacteria bacterium]
MTLPDWNELLVGALLLELMVSLPQASADGGSLGSIPGQHIAQFRYDPNQAYTLITLPGVPTDVQLGSDEKITGLALGDTVQWMVEELPGHLFIKPLKSGLFTAGTLVTTRRVYQLLLKSTSADGPWMQKAYWEDALPAIAAELPAPASLDPAIINSRYRIDGDADFRPVRVFDDGRFTWIQVRSPQALPALFMVEEGNAVLVNYVVKGEYFVVQRLMPEMLLKLGSAEVRVINEKRASASRHQSWTEEAP